MNEESAQPAQPIASKSARGARGRFLKGYGGRREQLRELVESGNSLACSVVTVAELYAGVRPQHQKETEGWLELLDILNVTPPIARRAGTLRLEWRQLCRTLALTDTLIAATAMEHGGQLLTGNRKDFPMFFAPPS